MTATAVRTAQPTRVLVVEDHPTTRKGLELVLRAAGFEIAGTCGSVAEALALARRRGVDVYLVDVALPDGNGLALTRQLLALDVGANVILHTAELSEADLLAALATTQGIVLKLHEPGVLLSAIRSVAAGGTWFDPQLVGPKARAVISDRPERHPKPVLSAREREVFGMLATGLRGVEAADALGVSSETLRTHVRNGMAKLGARTRVQAVVAALERDELTFTA